MGIWTNFTRSIPQYAVDAYAAVDPWFYPILFIGIIGFIYTSMNSITVAIIAILITFGIFATTTSIFTEVSELTQFLYIITVVGLTMLIVTLILNKRRV